MNGSMERLYQERASEEEIRAILTIEKERSPLLMVNGFDIVLVQITDDEESKWSIEQYEIEGKRISSHTLSKSIMYHTLIVGGQRKLVNWIVHGEVKYDDDQFLKQVKERIAQFPINDRSKKMTIHFGRMLSNFEEGKLLFKNRHFFDAFSHMMYSLYHLAHLSVIHHGYYPETTVWEQVKKIEPPIYKLYHELLKSDESLEKRIELLILTMELAIHSKTEVGSHHFLSVLHTSIGVWSIDDFLELQEVSEYREDLEFLIQHLVDKGYLIREKIETTSNEIGKVKYYYKKNKKVC